MSKLNVDQKTVKELFGNIKAAFNSRLSASICMVKVV